MTHQDAVLARRRRGEQKSAATLKDVARIAGVSTATVARVLHKNGYVAEQTRGAVEAAIAQSGYQLNAVAQGLRKRRTFTIGHVLESIAPNPFFSTVALGVEANANDHGCGVLTVNTQGDATRERLAVEMLIRRRVDAILFTTCNDSASLELAIDNGIPVAQVERLTSVETDGVTVDNHLGSFQATSHLLDLGHRRIAYLGVGQNRTAPVTSSRYGGDVERERFEGFSDALAHQGMSPNDALVRLDGSYYDLDFARSATAEWLALPREERPTAIFAACDVLAAGVLQQAYALGLRIPNDLSVVGFDDTDASLLTPPLTTVAQPMHALGSTAAQIVIDRLQEADPFAGERRVERLATALIVRDSSGPAPAGG